MTKAEWLSSDDPVVMLKALRAHWRAEEAEFERLVQRYLLACCRAIRRLLPIEGSRNGVEVAERHIDRGVSREEWFEANWHAEGAAMTLELIEDYRAYSE